MNTARIKILSAAALVTAFGLASATASAGTAPGGTFTVTATVAASCKTATANNLAFGSLDPSVVVADTYVSDSIAVQCTNKTPFTVLMNAGANPGTAGNVTTRQMKDAAGDFLPYHLCITTGSCTTGDIANSTTPPAGTTNLTGTGTGTGAGNAATVNFFGLVTLANLQTAVASTSYTDTITVTISF